MKTSVKRVLFEEGFERWLMRAPRGGVYRLPAVEHVCRDGRGNEVVTLRRARPIGCSQDWIGPQVDVVAFRAAWRSDAVADAAKASIKESLA